MHPAPPPFPIASDASDNRLLLRDGSLATLRRATPADVPLVRAFFTALPPDSPCRRSPVRPETLVEGMCCSPDPRHGIALVAFGQRPGGPGPVALAAYAPDGSSTAEVVVAVLDAVSGKGFATALLDRLAALAAASGFGWLHMRTFEDNTRMLDVLHGSGFELRSRTDRGLVDVRLNLAPPPSGLSAAEERRRLATIISLRAVLEPRSIVIVGPVGRPSDMARRVYDAMLDAGFTGSVDVVDPATTMLGGRPCLASVTDLPGEVDLAVVTAPADRVPTLAAACGSVGVRALLVLSTGFAESGEHGSLLQERLADTARTYGLRLVGPASVGVMNTNLALSLNASLAPRLAQAGPIALASQVGGVGLALLQHSADRAIGLSSFVSLGNKADVSGNDVLLWAEHDRNTAVILLYLESFGNPRRFGMLARRIAREKPIVVVKSGRRESGGAAAGAAREAGQTDAAVDALFQQSGVIRAEAINELFDIGACLALQPLPAGRRLSIVTNASGPGILAADACEAARLIVEPFTEPTRARLASLLVPDTKVSNPLDLTPSAGPDAYRRAVEAVLAAGDTDALLIIYAPTDRRVDTSVREAIADGVVTARGRGVTDKPVVACVMGQSSAPESIPAGAEHLPAYAFPESGVRALGRAWAYRQWRTQTPGLYWSFDEIHADEARALCRAITAARGDTWLTREELTRLLNAFGLPLAASAIATTADEAVALASIIGYPVVLKLSSDEVLRKAAVGGVCLNLVSAEDVRRAFDELALRLPPTRTEGAPGGVLVQPMLTGVETFVGLVLDPQFGPLVAFGLGGPSVEGLSDVRYRMAPLTDKDADDLMKGVRGYQWLEGRGERPAADLDALREVLLRVSLIGQHVPEVVELELNPAIALPEGHGCRIVDSRARVRASEGDAEHEDRGQKAEGKTQEGRRNGSGQVRFDVENRR